jgi:cyclopropane-fatty-acyl-phospholipid synthase
MGGRGYYDSHSAIQGDTVLQQTERLRRAVRELGLDVPELHVIDYGCGPGRNSMAAFRAVLDEARRLRADLPIVAVHNDQIGNDWNDLIANIEGPDGYLKGVENVRVVVSARSFFERVASLGGIDLGMSFMASHWLPGAVQLHSPETLFFADMTGPERTEIAAVADRAWTVFLRQRALEVRPGGRLVFEAMSSVKDPQDRSGLAAGGHRLYRAFWRVADEMARDGYLDRAHLDTFVFPLYFRELEEIRAPLDREDDLKAAFEIVELEAELIANPYAEAWRRDRDDGAYARAYAAFARGFSESAFRNGLFTPSATAENDAGALADMFFTRLETLFREEAGRHDFDNHSMTLVLARR